MEVLAQETTGVDLLLDATKPRQKMEGVAIKIVSPINGTFLRTNRSSGQKSLRCFPACCERGHCKGGFCGRSLLVEIRVQKSSSALSGVTLEDIEKMLFVAELRPTSTESLSSKASISKDEVHACARGVTRASKTSDVKVGTMSNFEWLLGQRKHVNDTASEFMLVVEFNEDLHSWDYRWKSNRWIVDETHVIDITLLTPDAAEQASYNVVASQTSHTFTIFSARHITTNPNSILGPTPMTYAQTTAPSKTTDPFFIKRKDKNKRQTTDSASLAVVALAELAKNTNMAMASKKAKADAQEERKTDLSAEALLLISCTSHRNQHSL